MKGKKERDYFISRSAIFYIPKLKEIKRISYIDDLTIQNKDVIVISRISWWWVLMDLKD